MEDQQHLAELKAQLVTLTQSLTTLTSEKSKMEATYQAEKKKMRVHCSHLVAVTIYTDRVSWHVPRVCFVFVSKTIDVLQRSHL